MPTNHRLAKRRSVRLAQLREEDWCVWDEKRFPGFARPVIASCARAGFHMRVRAQVDSLAGTFLHVAEGRYVSHAPDIARSLARPGVVFLPTEPANALEIPLALVWRREWPHAEALDWLSRTIRDAHEAARVRGRG